MEKEYTPETPREYEERRTFEDDVARKVRMAKDMVINYDIEDPKKRQILELAIFMALSDSSTNVVDNVFKLSEVFGEQDV